MPARLDSARIKRAMRIVTELMELDPSYGPILDRLEDELPRAIEVEAAKRRPVRA